MAEKKKRAQPHIHYEYHASPDEVGEELHSEREKQVSQSLLDSYAKGLEEAKKEGFFQITIPRAERKRINKMSRLHVLEEDFLLSRRAKGNSEDTIRSYKDNFVRIYEYIGFTNTRDEVNKEVMEGMSDRHLNFGIREIGKITPIAILESDDFPALYRDYLLNVRKLSPYTVESSMRHFRAICYYAQENEWIRKRKIPLIESKPPIKETFSEKDMERLSRKPSKERFVPYRTWVMIHYLASTGNRVSSMLGLNVEDIDFDNNTITIQVSKDREPKQMPLLLPLARILREYIIEYRSNDDDIALYGEPLFCNQFGERLPYRSAYDAFDDYFAERGLTFNGFHKFRHSYGANWVRQGGNAFMLKEQLGHKTLAMTNRYANIYGMATRQEAEKFSLSKKLKPAKGRTTIKRKK